MSKNLKLFVTVVNYCFTVTKKTLLNNMSNLLCKNLEIIPNIFLMIGEKNPTDERQSISGLMRIVAPIQKNPANNLLILVVYSPDPCCITS